MSTKATAATQRSFLFFLGALLVIFVVMMRPFWVPAGLAVVTVILCSPLHQWALKLCRNRRYLAACVSLTLVCAFILLPLGAIVATIITEIIRFSQHLVVQLQDGQLAGVVDEMNLRLRDLLSRLGDIAPTDLDLRAAIVGAAKVVGKTLYQFSPQVVASTAHVMASVVLWLVFVFVFFADGGRLYHYLMEISPLSSSHEAVISKEVREMVSAALLAMVATSAVNGILMALAFWIWPLERPVMWGLVTFGLSFIPIIGAFSIWFGAAVYLLLIGQWGWALGLCAFGMIVIAQADNVVKPVIMRGRVNIHPILLFLSLLGGIGMMGPTGLIFGPVFMAVLLACIRIYRREYV